MEAKHTPGPWTRNANGDLIFSPPIYPAADDPQRLCSMEICRIAGHRTFFGEPNARLIVAAPELLAACEAIMEFLSNGTPVHPGAFVQAEVFNAIRKAKGN